MTDPFLQKLHAAYNSRLRSDWQLAMLIADMPQGYTYEQIAEDFKGLLRPDMLRELAWAAELRADLEKGFAKEVVNEWLTLEMSKWRVAARYRKQATVKDRPINFLLSDCYKNHWFVERFRMECDKALGKPRYEKPILQQWREFKERLPYWTKPPTLGFSKKQEEMLPGIIGKLKEVDEMLSEFFGEDE
jgi:hypothetical protein